MSEHPLISILLPFKNEEKFISECLNSILIQTYRNWEVVAVDDNSSDSSPEIVKQFSLNNPRIRYIVNEGLGVIAALQTGLAFAKGNCISRMDADDYKSENNLQAMVELLDPGVISIGQVKYFREGGLGDGYAQYETWINAVNREGRTWNEVYRECTVPSPCWLVYKKDLIRAGGFDSNLYPEDYDLCLRFYGSGLKPRCTSEVIHFWRDHEIRTTRVSPHYADNRFTTLKVHHFLRIDYSKDLPIFLVGAGSKAKKVAQLLIDSNVNFRWLTSNSKKVGHNIYGVFLENLDTIEIPSSSQVLVAIHNYELLCASEDVFYLN